MPQPMFQLHTLPTSIMTPAADYPLADECGRRKDDEQEKAQKIWAYCFSPYDRIKYIRKHRAQFGFDGYSQMIDVVRGRCFTGCASELVNWRDRVRVRVWRFVLSLCAATWLAIVLLAIRAAS
ncbi:hypothetical protein [Bradyrhizobium sp. CCGB01]|uniref:hypothetical protein n=1 Tax=Bradyrhizobium sp. CCGB01 TaxID=2949634 RepID=UPI0020B23850|nr:hypothetical protein [Bradyrhizobium sp. CCGB01]MCP3405507.1 hypothetical protein [Bradyrhizobium sp. CCGB01]